MQLLIAFINSGWCSTTKDPEKTGTFVLKGPVVDHVEVVQNVMAVSVTVDQIFHLFCRDHHDLFLNAINTQFNGLRRLPFPSDS